MSLVTLTTNNNNRGSVSGGGSYTDGSRITVTANSNSGYLFAYWHDGTRIVSSLPSYTFDVNGDITLTAYFYTDVEGGVKVYGLCEANCKYRTLTVGQLIHLIQEMAGNGWQVPANYIPATAVNEIIDQNSGLPVKIFIGTQSQWDRWTGDKTNISFWQTDDTTIENINRKITELSTDITSIKNGTIVVKKAEKADYASEDKSKGTIEERLTNLGFKHASVTIADNSKVVLSTAGAGAINKIDINQLGKIVYGKFPGIGFSSVTGMGVADGSDVIAQTEPIFNVSGVKGTDVAVVLATGEHVTPMYGVTNDIVSKVYAILKNNQIYLIIRGGLIVEGYECTLENVGLTGKTFVLDFYNVSDGETVKVFN